MSGTQRMANNNMLGHCVSNGVAVGVAGAGGVGGVNNLRDICNFLQPAMNAATLPPGASSYDHIIDMMRGLNLQDDGIVMNHKIKSIETDFCHLVRDENMLCESMEYINDKALADGDTALKFALLFSSRNFDALAMNDTKVRSAMLKILETNFINADTYRVHDKERLYNSITLLGEYYHRVRLADNSPITILGESLLSLLIREVSQQDTIGVKLAKLILSQITLNGDIMRVKHKEELTQLLFHIRRNLIVQPSLKSAVKALLLMTLDLYYSSFTNLGAPLEEMYTKYLVQEDEDEGNNNGSIMQQPVPPLQQQVPSPASQQQQQVPSPASQQQQQSLSYSPQAAGNSLENGDAANSANDSYEAPSSTKKWSEQVCEDSLYESEFGNDYNGSGKPELTVSSGVGAGGDSGIQGRLHRSDQSNTTDSRYGDDQDSSSRNARRSQKPRSSPRPLKHQFNSLEGEESLQQQSPQSLQHQSGEERDQTKPLPRWRAPRFNRDGTDQDSRPRNQHRRYSTSFDDDRQSVRSEGGSIRLYSINDRLRHSQEKIERSGTNYNSIANSNWDQQSQHDDRSERSYVSNYERGNYRRGGRHHYNNRQGYDKPPRFQKNQQQQQSQSHPQQSPSHHRDNKIHSDSWRRSRGNIGPNAYPDENSSYRSNGPESNSRSSSRARTLPRPGKSHFDGANPTSSYRRSQSPHQQQRSRNYNAGRYSSQSSLVSETSSTFDRRHNPRNRNYGRQQQQRPQQQQQQDWEDTHSVHGQPEEQSWDTKNDNSELVRNARQTTNYMNYLSSQK